MIVVCTKKTIEFFCNYSSISSFDLQSKWWLRVGCKQSCKCLAALLTLTKARLKDSRQKTKATKVSMNFFTLQYKFFIPAHDY